MASILDKYGIKEVADVCFYELGDTGLPTKPVLYLDTLKTSTVEQTGEEYDARGGKGNTILISWDSNKEINVTLEDALFSAKSMAIMFGNGTAKKYNSFIMRTEEFRATSTGAVAAGADACGWKYQFEDPNGKLFYKYNPKFYDEVGNAVTSVVSGNKYFCSYDVLAEGAVIDVSANSFPGTYYVTGDTYARSNESGKDEFFQLIFPKAKVTSENTITLEADGDPSVFNMNLKLLRPADGVMMKLVKYNLIDGTDATHAYGDIVHNHSLATTNAFETVSLTVGGSAYTKTIASASAATSSKSAVATVAVNDTVVTITPVSAGSAVVTVKDSGEAVIMQYVVDVAAAG